VIESGGFYSFSLAEDNFDMGNSGTSCRLISGILAGIPNKISHISGDSSLSKRPMGRIVKPLQLMGANITGDTLPMVLYGKALQGIHYCMDVPSAQVKSCILLAGLFAAGQTQVVEKDWTRDHTENMLKNLGVNINVAAEGAQKIITLNNNQKDLPPADYAIPNDFSSASFFIALALITPDSEVLIKNVNLNPLRTGFLTVLLAMGANIEVINKQEEQGEPVGDLLVKSSQLRGVKVLPEVVPAMIDEFPIASIVAAFAEGKTEFMAIGELRHKESDRINSIVSNFQKLGIKFEVGEDFLSIEGSPKKLAGGAVIESFYDHRIAMAFLIMGAACESPIQVKGCESINTSFPNFFEIASRVGLKISK
jgi:3-phosphoshikimate 1-carboxyvinyltransferase